MRYRFLDTVRYDGDYGCVWIARKRLYQGQMLEFSMLKNFDFHNYRRKLDFWVGKRDSFALYAYVSQVNRHNTLK